MIHLESISKVYSDRRRGDVRALDDVSLAVSEAEFVAIKGPSGSGKSTLLMAVGGMNRPSAGRAVVDGVDLYGMSSQERAQFRADKIGFVFQMFHLVPYLNVIENVLLPTVNDRSKASRDGALALLERFGMSGRLHHKPAELSTGERQRTAMARALLNRPKLVLADEPTGNLDPENAAEVMGYLSEFQRDGGTVVLVTHEGAALEHAERIVRIRQGKIEPGDGSAE